MPRLSSLHDPGRIARLAIAVLALLLLALNLGAHLMLRRAWQTQQRLLREGLETSAAVVAGAMTPDTLFFLDVSWEPSTGTTDLESLASYAGLPSALALQRALADVSARHSHMDVALLAPDGRVLVDAQGFHLDPDEPLPDLDRDAIARARQGATASTPVDPQSRTQRAYHPLAGTDGQVIGLVRVESSGPTAFPYARILRRLNQATLLSAAVIVLLWAILGRLVRRARAMERAADQSDRLRALGTATAGIAHEIRNPLGILTLLIEELRQSARRIADEPQRAAVEGLANDLRDEVRRLGALTNQFLDFIREDAVDVPPPIDAVAAVGATLRLFEKGTPPHVEIVWQPTPNSLPIRFGENRLRQVMLNLLGNAANALANRPSGRLVVHAERVRDRVRIEVRDNGPGMDAETLAHAFDPFYTTRAEGSGLGLPLSRSLVEAAGGRLTLDSQPGHGTVARIEFPIVDKV